MRYSYSQISTYASCPVLYKFKYVDHLQAIGESEHDLRFGKAWDAAMNVLYSGKRTGQEAVSYARDAFALSYPPKEFPAVLSIWSQGKSFQGGLDGIAEYAERYQQEDENWEVVSIQSRDKATTDDGDERSTVLDLVIRDRRDGLIYGVDNKTTGKYLDSDYWLQFDPHSQIRQYVDHLQRKYGECGGFYINAASFRHRSKAYTFGKPIASRVLPDFSGPLTQTENGRLRNFSLVMNGTYRSPLASRTTAASCLRHWSALLGS